MVTVTNFAPSLRVSPMAPEMGDFHHFPGAGS